jgi:hypothetical protein
MNIDYHVGYAAPITWENIKKLCPQPCALVELALSNAGLDMDRWLKAVAHEDSNYLCLAPISRSVTRFAADGYSAASFWNRFG